MLGSASQRGADPVTTAISLRRQLALVALAAALLASGCTELKRWAYAGRDRDSWQQPDRVLSTLEIAPGDRVADLGAGGGYFTFRLAQAVGEGGRVFAVDVDEGMNDALREDIAERGATNIEVVQAAYDDPRLALGSVDLVFTSNTYHHIQDRVAYFERVAPALSQGGRVAIIDFKPEGFFQKRHATSSETIRAEMASAGYALVDELDFLERQSFLVFEPERAR
jgi:ubiquinone/menaquinone biosynthesis C-methylase UbiE